MARGERERPGPPLPAPYRNPWSGLAEALRAVVADRRLALQRLWRRNRDGELPLPGFWPRDLAPLFWPLLLCAILALLLGLGGWLLKRAEAPTSPTVDREGAAIAPLLASRPEESLPRTAEPPVETATAGAARSGSIAPPGPGTSAPSGSGPDPASGGAPHPSDAGSADRGAVAGDGSGTTSRPGPPATELRLDPLLELLGQGEDADLLLAARPNPAASRLSLTLAPAAEALPQAELLERAQRWQQRAQEAGYERLELRDPQGRLRGRGALVGSGMILLAPVPGA